MENQRVSSDGEDIPSDFFDDFNKDEFIEGLSVIDSWDDGDKKGQSSRARINSETIDNVRDLRELIARDEDDNRQYQKPDPKYRWKRNKSPSHKQSKYQPENNNLDDYIKPGSRRDPNKTNEAIRRDKEVKVKEYLAKHLESNSDLCPPGTELEFFEERKSVEMRKRLSVSQIDAISPLKEHRMKLVQHSRESPVRRRESPPRYRRMHESPRRMHESPRRMHESPRRMHESPRRMHESPRRMHDSPRRMHHSPHRNFRPNFRYHSPYKNTRKFYRYSPDNRRRVNPEIRRERRSRSPYKRVRRQSRSRSPGRRSERDVYRRSLSAERKFVRDEFLYPKDYAPPNEHSVVKTEIPYQVEPEPHYATPVPVEYGDAPIYPYTQDQGYSGYSVPYEYGVQPTQQMVLPPVPQPVPAPIISSTTTSPTLFNPVQPLPVVVPPQHVDSSTISNQSLVQNIPEPEPSIQADALAKLVTDGKLSHEDYLKLAPNKGVSQNVDTHARVAVLDRCHNAMSRLGTIVLPNQLLINNTLIGPEQKQIAPKFCSPLKRQASTEFHFSKYNTSAVARQNKLIVDSIIATLHIEKVVGRTKKMQKDTKDAAVQTIKPFCDVCAIRESTTFNNAETSIDRELLCSTVHTQVVEQELLKFKSMFNPTGGIAEGANMSIAHMTPAQLVSQLAARAKTLKQTEAPQTSNQFRPSQSFDYDSRGSDNQYRRNQYNYRY